MASAVVDPVVVKMLDGTQVLPLDYDSQLIWP